MSDAETDRLIRLREIIGPAGLIPVSRSSFYQGVRDGIYPAPIRLGKRTSAWRLSDLMAVIRGEHQS